MQETSESTASRLLDASNQATNVFREAAEGATMRFQHVAVESTRNIEERLQNSTDAFREAGLALKTEFDETASIVNAAFMENGRSTFRSVGARAVEINDTMRNASSELIEAMENRGLEAGRLIEEKGGKIAEILSSVVPNCPSAC